MNVLFGAGVRFEGSPADMEHGPRLSIDISPIDA
jgi:hypothetical protein